MPQVQHDALMAGGTFTMLGGLLIIFSVLMPVISLSGSDQNILDMIDVDNLFIIIPLASALGVLVLAISSLTLFRVFVSKKPLNRMPLIQSILAMGAALVVISSILLLQREYQGEDALYGAGAFMQVIGAILLMSGALLVQLMSGRRKPSTTGFQALAERSGVPVGRKGWKPPETSVKPPACPSCGAELRPGWKACPNCGYALLTGDMERRESL